MVFGYQIWFKDHEKFIYMIFLILKKILFCLSNPKFEHIQKQFFLTTFLSKFDTQNAIWDKWSDHNPELRLNGWMEVKSILEYWVYSLRKEEFFFSKKFELTLSERNMYVKINGNKFLVYNFYLIFFHFISAKSHGSS